MRRPRLFATSLSIANFRGYGGRFRLDLPGEPCVVLLSGPNGLGKTSLFEAIEWNLTDSVRRLDVVANGRVDRRELARRATGVDAFEVELSFRDEEGNEEKITRTQVVPKGAAPPSVGTTLESVAQILRVDDAKWRVTGSNIGAYLHLTHVHAQVAALRFVTSTSKERWVKVSPLAGADRFDRVLLNLTNTKQALTKLSTRAVAEREVARERKQRWDSLLMRLAQAQGLAAAVREALSPKEITGRISDSARSLSLSVANVLPTEDLVAASEQLRSFREALEEARAGTDDRLKTIAHLRTVARQYADLGAQQTKLQARLKELDAELISARLTAEKLAENARVNRDAHERERNALDTAIEIHERLQLALQIGTDLARFEAEAVQLKEQLAQAEKSADDAEVDHRKRVEDFAAHEKVAADGDAQRRRLRLVEEGMAAVAEIEAFEKQLAIEDGKIRETDTAMRANAAATKEVIDERNAAGKALAEAEGQLQALRVGAAEFQRALLAIAEHVSDSATHCPVCSSQFAPLALKTLAREAVARSDPRIGAAEARVAVLRGTHEALQKREGELSREKRRVDADWRAASEKAVQLRNMISDLRKKEPLNIIQGIEYRPALGRVRDDATKNLLRIEKQLDSGRAIDVLRQALVDAAAKIDSTRRARAVETERYNARVARVSELRARRTQLVESGIVDASDEVLVRNAEAAASLVASARASSESAAAKNAESAAAEAAAHKKVVEHTETLARESGQRPSIEGGLAAYEGEWRAARLSLPISESTLGAEEGQLGRRRGQLDVASAGLPQLSASLQRWHDAEELQRIETDVRAEHAPLSRGDYTRSLDESLARANRAVDDANRARQAADELGAKLQDVTADFGEAALKPFDDLFRRYLRTLIHDDRFHEIEATYESSARTAGLSFKVLFGGAATDAEYLLSEGQLGEVSLAAMLAASTAFPWSRWRALLLDDPTQYNDLIHATALYDVLRNLVGLAGYQVFFSTHDNEQAAFFRRKLDAVGIKWVDCRFRAHTPEGIAVDVQSASGNLDRVPA